MLNFYLVYIQPIKFVLLNSCFFDNSIFKMILSHITFDMSFNLHFHIRIRNVTSHGFQREIMMLMLRR